MQNDEVKFISNEEGEVLVIGISGWCIGMELTFTPKQFVIHFESTVFYLNLVTSKFSRTFT
jgi:hypothetical protein